MSKVVLTAGFDVDAAIAAAANGSVDKGVFVQWAKENPIPMDKVPALFAIVPSDISAILTAQSALIAANAVAGLQPTGELRLKVAKRGGISIYGLNSRQPVTLYAGQCERLVKWMKAADDNPVTKFIAGNPSSVFEAKDFDASQADKDYLAEVRRGEHPHAKVVGDKIHVHLSRKA